VGKAASTILSGAAALKLGVDGVNYFRALVACSLDPTKK
jgi:hypothetical protein